MQQKIRVATQHHTLIKIIESHFAASGYAPDFVTADHEHQDAIEVQVLPLSQISTEQKDATIAALLPRYNPEYHLFIYKNKYNENNLLGLPPNAKIKVKTPLGAAHILDYNTNFNIVNDTDNNIVATDYDAYLGDIFDTANFSSADFVVKQLATAEATPPPAQGILALTCHTTDILLQLQLHNLNHAPTVQCSNVERRALQQLGYDEYKDILGVYCHTDTDHNYHVFIALATTEGLKTARLAHTGRKALVDVIVQKVKEMQL